jgi:chaperonin GroES
MSSLNIRPLHDRVIVERIQEEKIGTIVIPDTVGEKPVQAKVLAVGPGKRTEDGTLNKPDVKVGDKVLFGKYSGTEVRVDGKDLLVMREEDIMGILEG